MTTRRNLFGLFAGAAAAAFAPPVTAAPKRVMREAVHTFSDGTKMSVWTDAPKVSFRKSDLYLPGDIVKRRGDEWVCIDFTQSKGRRP